MSRIWNDYKGAVIAVLALIVILLMSVVIVPETHQAVVIWSTSASSIWTWRAKPSSQTTSSVWK